MTYTTASRAENPALTLSEDWLSVIIGLLIFALALAALSGADLLGWTAITKPWTDPTQALAPFAKSYGGLNGFVALFATYAALLVVLSAAAAALKADVRRFALAFSAVFWIA
jgi:hypothetical protein